jgi:hypothetical protein
VIWWPEQLELMRLVAARYPHGGGRPVAMCRRGKRGRGRLRQAMILSMRVAAGDAVRRGEQVLVDRDGRRRLAPHQVYDMRARALRLERDDALAVEYRASQSSATRAIDGDTYRDVSFPIRITHPDVRIEIFYPYLTAITILATAPIDQRFTIAVQPHTPRLRISGLFRLADQVLPAAAAAARPHTPVDPTEQDPAAHTSPPPPSHSDSPTPRRDPPAVTPTPSAAADDRWRRRRRFG